MRLRENIHVYVQNTYSSIFNFLFFIHLKKYEKVFIAIHLMNGWSGLFPSNNSKLNGWWKVEIFAIVIVVVAIM